MHVLFFTHIVICMLKIEFSIVNNFSKRLIASFQIFRKNYYIIKLIKTEK